jgi:hypothetical protein
MLWRRYGLFAHFRWYGRRSCECCALFRRFNIIDTGIGGRADQWDETLLNPDEEHDTAEEVCIYCKATWNTYFDFEAIKKDKTLLRTGVHPTLGSRLHVCLHVHQSFHICISYSCVQYLLCRLGVSQHRSGHVALCSPMGNVLDRMFIECTCCVCCPKTRCSRDSRFLGVFVSRHRIYSGRKTKKYAKIRRLVHVLSNWFHCLFLLCKIFVDYVLFLFSFL